MQHLLSLCPGRGEVAPIAWFVFPSGLLSLASFHVVIGYSAFMCLWSSERQTRASMELGVSLV